MGNQRLNIGLYVSNLIDESVYSVCKGAKAAAEHMDANLIIFPGMHLNGDYNDPLKSPYYYQYNTIYDIGRSGNIDVLIVMTGIIGNTLSASEIQEFLQKFNEIPILTISTEYPGYSSIKFDNEIGLKKAINHIIRKHNCRRIGFVSGSKLNSDARERLEVYYQTLLENNLPIDHNLIVYGNFSEFCEIEVQNLIKNNPDIDAICFANDEMAKGGYRALAHSNRIVGKDISVIGFDNTSTAVNIYPHLTTVSANNFELGYQALINSVDMLENKEIKRITVPTNLIIRNSCGCKNTSSEKMSYLFSDVKLTREQISSFSVDDYMDYLFGNSDAKTFAHNFSFYGFENLKQNFKNFLIAVLDENENIKPKQYRKQVYSAIHEIISSGVLKYLPYDTVFNVIDALYCKVSSLKSRQDDAGFVFTQIYREFSAYSRTCDQNELLSVQHNDSIINAIVNDVIITGEPNDQAFFPIMKRLSDLGVKRSYMMIFEQPVMHTENSDWVPPEKIYLKFSQVNDDIKHFRSYPEIAITNLFRNEYISSDSSSTLVVSPLFSNEELYGSIICEMSPDLYKYLNRIGLQISTALKYNNLLNSWQTLLANEKENSKNFERISKHDELTGVFNRRGYFDNAQSIIVNPSNAGKNAIVVFADMDNLKTVNDQFGHDDGDYSLKSIADILLRSFRTTDIVGRIGGDEFAVFALLGNSENVNHITNRINKTTDKFNNASSKPYYVSMSLGIYQFVCSEDINISDILDNADSLLYKNKANKRKSILKEN